MSDAGRFYNILRSYVGREWERVRDLDLLAARDELEKSTGKPDSSSTTEVAKEPLSEVELESQARKVLGVEPDADFPTIRRQFDRLNDRSKPDKFPEGTPEQEVARQLNARVNWAYNYLTRHVSDTSRRFGSLEID